MLDKMVATLVLIAVMSAGAITTLMRFSDKFDMIQLFKGLIHNFKNKNKKLISKHLIINS